MALNPPLSASGDPLRVTGEHFIIQRNGVEFEVKIPSMGKLKGKGTMILTTNRVILLNNKDSADFKAFDLPLALMFKESFE